jgi:serine/threonine protein kinase
MAERGSREGQRIGNYRLERLIGRGGFAEVYLGEHLYLKTSAAIKLLHMNMLRKDAREDFLKEAQTIARLHHPHIVRVMDFGVERKTPFLVMEYAPNGTLHQRYPNGTPLPLRTILSYFRQIVDALQHAHDEGVIHCDITPANMLVGRHNEVLLTDFGIAQVIQRIQDSNVQQVVGTIAYMAPEQILGLPVPASDQYSLGIVVYEWLCGERPFHGSFKEISQQQLSAPPPSLQEKVPTISPRVEQVVMRALAKDPEQRFPNVQAFASALEEVGEAGETEEAEEVRPISSAIRTSSQSEPLPPTVIAPLPKQEPQQTEKVVQIDKSPLPQTEAPGRSQGRQLSRTPVSQKPLPPLGKRFQATLITGGISGLLGALLQIILALMNAPLLREASKEFMTNRLTVSTALTVVGVESLNLLIGLFVSFVAGLIVGKITRQRRFGIFAGVLSGITLYVVTFLVSYLPDYPVNITVRGIGAGLAGGSLVLSLVFLSLWAIISGLIGLLGARLTRGSAKSPGSQGL